MNPLNPVPHYYRFNRSHPYRAPKLAHITIDPIIQQGRNHPWEEGMMLYREQDKLKGFHIALTGFNCETQNGVFEFWTKSWSGDKLDEEWPWIHWQFLNVEWKGQLGFCEIDSEKQKEAGWNFRKITGWMYEKKVPRL